MTASLAEPTVAGGPAAPLAGAVRLQDWGLIRAQGEDAAKFLHGQLTQDIEHLAPAKAVLAGYCSAKGRLLASFVVWRPAADTLLLACSADLLPGVLKRLQMYVLRARCKLSDASAELPLWGLAGPAGMVGAGSVPADAAVWSSNSTGCSTACSTDNNAGKGHTVRLPDAVVAGRAVPRWLVAGDLPAKLDDLPMATWQALEVHSGVARVVAATSEQFVPQMVNLELVGGVNFQKGCYPGQEVVARSQYRGTLKRRAQVMHCHRPMQPGQEVFHSADPEQPAGQVVLAGSFGGGDHCALVEVKLATLGTGSLHLQTATGPLLTLAALPYAIPADQG